ncbi:FUSC family protein [Bradyrhizobium sp. USDA 4502]
MNTAVARRQLTFVGLPASSWALAIRIWLAIILALYVAFWLELEAPSTAALTVTVLALPTRGQVLEKALFRLFATTLGIAASIAIVGIFAQTEILLLIAFAVWLGICVYAAGLLDGNRAYAAALSGYTVAIVAIQQIDNPQHTFESGMARGAAIAVGVLAVTLVNDLLSAPDQHPRLAAKLEAIRLQVVGRVRSALRGDALSAISAAALLRDVVALRPEINGLAAELSSGPVRSSAARNAMVSIVAELVAVRAVEKLAAHLPPSARDLLTSALDRNVTAFDAPAVAVFDERNQAGDLSDPNVASLLWMTDHLLRTDGETQSHLDALRAGQRPARPWRAPLYRSHRIAAESSIRAGGRFLLVAGLFAMSGWPSVDISLSFVAIIVALGATTPDPRAFTLMAAIAAPIAALFAGILEFAVLDGATAFPLLAVGLAPFTIGSALLMTVPNRILSALGRINLVWVLLLFSPSNPQTYNPQSFLFSVLFLVLATIVLLAVEIVIPSVSRDRCMTWLLESIRRDLACLPSRTERKLLPGEAVFRDASRIAQILGSGDNGSVHQAAVNEAMGGFDKAAALRLCEVELDGLPPGQLSAEVAAAYAALATRHPDAMIASASALREAGSLRNTSVAGASAALLLASIAFAEPRSIAEASGEATS